jgi:hypothetical protein
MKASELYLPLGAVLLYHSSLIQPIPGYLQDYTPRLYILVAYDPIRSLLPNAIASLNPSWIATAERKSINNSLSDW